VNALEPALAGGTLERPLLAPRFAALAAEVEELPLEAFLADLGRRARIYADLARSLRVDVLFVNDADEEPDVLADLLQRVRATVPTTLGAVVTGPATRGDMPSVLAAARAVAEAGAEVVLIRETAPLDGGYARLANPLWGSLKFFRAVGVLLAPNPPAARDSDWATFEAAWSQLSPPEDLLVWFGSWPEGIPAAPVMRM
jgi:hypothetical protein